MSATTKPIVLTEIIEDPRSVPTVKTDTTLMGWIGDNYKPSSSPDGWQDAPSFSNRVRETPESVAIIVSGRTMRVPNPAGAVEKLDAKINRYSELLKCLQ